MTISEFIKQLNVEDINKEIKVVDIGDFVPLTHIEKTPTAIEIHTMVLKNQIGGCGNGACGIDYD